MNEKETTKNTAGHGFRKVVVRTLNLLWITAFSSVIYMGLIKAGIFELLGDGVKKIGTCVIEILVLCAYWCYIYRFSHKCRHRTSTVKKYYLRTCIIFAAFSAAYFLAYRFLEREVFTWGFRLTLNLACLEADAVNLLPYMLAYLVITFLVMLLEPRISKRISEKRKEKRDRWK